MELEELRAYIIADKIAHGMNADDADRELKLLEDLVESVC